MTDNYGTTVNGEDNMMSFDVSVTLVELLHASTASDVRWPTANATAV